MGNYEQLKQSVSDVIKTNGNQEITGSILQNVLLTIISTVGANATFVGIATPATNPGTPDGPVLYLASEGGTYTNFSAIELQDGLSVLMWNGSWSSQQILSVDDVPTAGSDNLVKSGGVQQELALGAVYDVSAKNPTAGPNNDGKFESLSALLEDANLDTLIPASIRKGGMSIKFVQSTDNKYVQYTLRAESFTTSIGEWFNDEEDRGKEIGCIRLIAISSSRPSDIKDGEYYWHYPTNSLEKMVNGSAVDQTPKLNTFYSCNGQIYYFDGTKLALIPSNNLNNITAVGNGSYGVRTNIILRKDHYYKLIVPKTWTKPTDAPYVLYVEDPNGYDVNDTNGVPITPTSFELKESFLFKATYSNTYVVGMYTSSGEIISVNIIDVTEEINSLFTDANSLLNNIQVGDILSYAPVGSVPPLTVESDTKWRYIDIKVKEGETYLIRGSAGVNPRLWCILDAENVVLDVSASALDASVWRVIYMPKNAVRLIINFNTLFAYYFGALPQKNLNLSFIINNKLQGELELNIGGIKCGGDIGSKPTLETDNDSNWRHCNIQVNEGEVFEITGKGGRGVDYPLYSIIGQDGRIIATSEQTATENNKKITIPVGGKTLACNMLVDYPYVLKGIPNNFMTELIKLEKADITLSPYYRDVNYGVVPTEDYVGQGDNYSWGDETTLTAEVYNKFDTLINTLADISDRTIDVNDGYVFRHYIGNACDNQPLCVYEFNPPRISVSAQKDDNPKIFILCGQHGFEKQSTFGIYYLLNDVINNTEDSLVAKYIREFVHLYVVPVANPSGWDAKEYVNGNGVNLNRNWYVNGWAKQTTPATEATGDAPFDQPETAALRDYINTIDDMLLFMDCHQNGAGIVTYQNVNWIDITKVSNDVFYNRILNVASFEISSNTRLFRNLYQSEIGGSNEMLGRIGNPDPSTRGYADLWAVQQKKIIGITHEGFGGFPLGTVNNPTSHKANSELLGNFIKNFLCYYSR